MDDEDDLLLKAVAILDNEPQIASEISPKPDSSSLTANVSNSGKLNVKDAK